MRFSISPFLSLFLGSKTVLAQHAEKKRNPDALLVLPGFGYGKAGARHMHRVSQKWAKQGIDVYVADYLDREGLEASRQALGRFIDQRRLCEYERLHVFAFIAGAWILNPYLRTWSPPNLVSVVYDRSPMQERAPRVATERLGLFAYLAVGKPVFELARTAYTPYDPKGVKVGLVVETKPTWLIRWFSATVRSYGPLRFDPSAFQQQHDDSIYVGMSHDEVYVQFEQLMPDLLSFARTGRFSEQSIRIPPEEDPMRNP